MDLVSAPGVAGLVVAVLGALIAAWSTRLLSRRQDRISQRYLDELTDTALSRRKDPEATTPADQDVEEPAEPPSTSTVDMDQFRRMVQANLQIRLERHVLAQRIAELVGQIEADEQRYRLLRSYAAQGLTQSKVSFTVSLGAAGIGFVIIMVGVVLSLTGAAWTQASIPVVSGAVIDAVALLFFGQDRRHQKTMFDFFERLREDRKLDEALALLRTTTDDEIKARIQAALVLHFAAVPDPLEVLRAADRRSGEDKPNTPGSPTP